ncbi:MAG: 2-hydroxy-acid oxidase, partial [Mesorhizobium sp.]
KTLLGKAGPLQEIAGDASRLIWRDVRDCRPFADNSEKPVWRVSMTPGQCHQMVLTLRMQAAVSAFYDWQGGLVWL